MQNFSQEVLAKLEEKEINCPAREDLSSSLPPCVRRRRLARASPLLSFSRF